MCGIVGVHAPGQEAAGLASLALFALQHRGQESAGVAVSDGEGVMVYKDLGMVAQVLDERRLPSLRGHLAIAHCRYSTTGSTLWENSQPSYRLGPRRAVAVGHNGNLVNTRQLLERLRGGKRRMSGTSDTELLTALLSDEPADDLVDALGRVLPGISGAFSLVVMDEQRVVGVRDPHGFRPLVLGRLPGEPEGWVLASETAALDILGADVVREVEPGEMVVLGEPGGPRSVRYAEGREHLCVFELIYFARPDSYMLGRSLYEARRRMGEELAREAPVDADMVMPVPDTGAPAAVGFAEASGLPYREGMVKNRYAGRTFIQPSQAMRQRGVNVKLSPLREQVRGRRLVVVDDSIVRGTTTKQIVALLRRAGATEVHLRISAPPIFHPCFYGIDTQVETELIAARMDLEGIRDYLGADSLAYLSIGGVLDALQLPRDRFCFACFDGVYPVPVPYDVASHKFVLEDDPVVASAVTVP
ncbi:MAG: amidophosphoribosyltransferase, amidophosphoribosyltransferase [Chloroflexi bacterium CSP1-4]|nr:MAG: amidophosphoribosyltransferase, amidophosphoribosyltransferase [Chloroflexi bacterium CSP1-4]